MIWDLALESWFGIVIWNPSSESRFGILVWNHVLESQFGNQVLNLGFLILDWTTCIQADALWDTHLAVVTTLLGGMDTNWCLCAYMGVYIYEFWTLIVYTNHISGSHFPRRTPPRAHGRRPGWNADSANHKRPGAGLAGVRSGVAA